MTKIASRGPQDNGFPRYVKFQSRTKTMRQRSFKFIEYLLAAEMCVHIIPLPV